MEIDHMETIEEYFLPTQKSTHAHTHCFFSWTWSVAWKEPIATGRSVAITVVGGKTTSGVFRSVLVAAFW